MLIGLMTVIALLLDRFVPINLTVTAVVLLAFIYRDARVYLPALLLGLVIDVSYVKVLGLSSLVLLVLAAVIMVLRLQFEWESVIFVVCLAILGEVVMGLWLGQVVSPSQLIGQGLVAGVAWEAMQRWGKREGVYLK